MFATTAYAQAAGAAAADAGPLSAIMPFAIPVMLVLLMYFLMIRPQQKRAKEHQAMISAVKRGDTVVLNNGMVGKVTRVEEVEAQVEISAGVNVTVVKAMIGEVRTRGEPVVAKSKS